MMSRYHFEAPQACRVSSASERHAHQRRDPKMQSLYLAAKAKPKGDDEDEDEDEDDVRRRTREEDDEEEEDEDHDARVRPPRLYEKSVRRSHSGI